MSWHPHMLPGVDGVGTTWNNQFGKQFGKSC